MNTVRRTVRSVLALTLAAVIPACGGGGGGGGGAPTPGSAPGAFNLLTPADVATGLSLTPTLTWENASDEVTYTLQIDTDNLFTAPLVYSATSLAVDTTSHPVPAATFSAGTTYFWRVSAVNASGTTTAANAPRSFTTGPAPGSFNLLTPADAAIGVSLTPTLTWENTSDEVTYTVEIDTDNLFTAPFVYSAASLAVDTTSHPVPAATLSGGTTYFWRVLALNASGTTTAANAPRSFTTAAVPTPFNHARGVDYQVWAIAAAADGSGDVYVGGELRSFVGQAIGGICRLNFDGSYDSNFVMGTGTRTGHVRAIAPLADGDVYVGGEFGEYNLTSVNRIVRLNSDGTIDAGFAIGTGFNGQVNAVTQDGSGNIYVGGTFTDYNGTTVNRIVRLTSTGVIDGGFATGTAFSAVGSYVAAITVDGSGNVVVGGQFSTYNSTGVSNIVRLTSAGAIDGTFTATSGGLVNAIAVAADATGDLFVGGTFSTFNGAAQNRLVRITSTGATVGIFVAGNLNNSVNRLVPSGSGVYVGGLFTAYGVTAVGRVMRLDSAGAIDAAFATGTGFNSDVQTIAPDGAGGVLAGGLFTAYNGVGVDRAACLNATGTLVNLPSGAGFSNPVNTVAFVPSTTDVYVGGTFTHYDGTQKRGLARLNSDGTIDATLDVGTGFVGFVNALAVASDGDLYVGGSITSYKGAALGLGIVRLNPDGTVDAGFTTGGTGFNGAVWAMAMASDATGDIYVAGLFTTWKGAAANRIVRLDPTGTIVGSFATGTGFDAGVFAIAIDGSGNVVAGGDFSDYNGTSSIRIARLSSTGVVDAAFSTATGTGFNGVVNALVIDGSGDIYAAGGFGQFNSGTASRLARLNSDGSADGGFSTGTGFNGIANALAVAPGNDVYVGGSFSSYKSSSVRPLVRLNSDGSVDGGFPASIAATTYAPGTVNVIAMLPDASGRLYKGGNITTWAGTTMDFFARLTAAGAVE